MRLTWYGVALLAVLSSATLMGAAADSKCDCPKDDPAAHGRVQTLIDSELSSTERLPTSGNLGFPKTVTVCMYFDPTNKGYPQDLKLVVESSLDGRMWFPATTAGRDNQASSANGCVQVAPSRYVRVGWPPAAQVVSPGPHVVAQVEVSY
jgi:hypothetical protein